MEVPKYKLGVVIQRAPVTLCQVVIQDGLQSKNVKRNPVNREYRTGRCDGSFSSRPASSTPGSTTDNAELSFSFTASDSAVYTAEKPHFPPVARLAVDNAC